MTSIFARVARTLLSAAVITSTLLPASQSFAGTTVTPTTTLAAETGNNTSAANSFQTSNNGNAGAGNVSKESVRKLLNAGSTTKIYAHFMAWWGSSSHINIGYDSANLTQVHSQISDMMSRGIDGLIIDWYGAGNTHTNQASLYVKQDAETRGGKFTFAIMEDQGAIRSCAYTSGCDVTQALINDFNYIVSTFASSPAYMRVNGQPLIFTFDVENLPNIDWTRVMANVQGNPKIILRNNQGFTKSYTSGSYSWEPINTSNANDWGQAYLDNFYMTSRSYPNLLVYAGTWKGFNDTAASWSQNRIVNQNCGQVWLATFNEMNKYFTSTPAPGVQLVTWNDYEEGTEIETGIDNCVAISGSVSGTTLNWNVSGQENTIDHFTVFISLDGQSLMQVASVARGTHSLDLAQYGFAPANYTLYVKAVGMPSMTNKMSAAIPATLGPVPPVAKLSVTPSSGIAPVSVTASTAGSTDADGTIASTKIDFGDGTVATTSSATHNYTAAGTYTVTATVTDNTNLSSTATAAVTVKANQAPVAAISVTPATGTAPVSVTASTANSTDDGGIISSSINFGDGTVVAGPTASHTYSNAGTYTVTGTVKDSAGLSSSATSSATVYANTTFTITPTSPSANASVSGGIRFTATTVSSSPVTATRIYVDNIGVYTVNAASIDTTLSLAPGSHYVVFQAWNQLNQVAKSPMNITVVNNPPTAKLSVSTAGGSAPLTVTASTAGSTDSDGTIKSVSIDFGDGTVAYTASASHTYSTPGVYTVTAKVTDNSGATATATASVTVYPASGIWIVAPNAGTTLSSPVRVTALAGGGANPIVTTRIYVDNKSAYNVNASSVDTSIPMAAGSHYIVVQAWDSTGKVYKAAVTITVK